MLAFEIAADLNILEGGKSLAMKSNGKKNGVQAKMKQARAKSDAQNSRMGELEARATEVEKQLETRASLVRVAESKYFFYFT